MRVAIIGGGYSGVAVAINILRRSLDEILLTLIERTDTTGQTISLASEGRHSVTVFVYCLFSLHQLEASHLKHKLWLRTLRCLVLMICDVSVM